jgi:ribosomal protein L11 methyltransferase
MKDKYFELIITPSSFFEEIESFLLDNFNNGIEELNGSIILRSDEAFEGLIKSLKIYVHSLEEIFAQKIELNIELLEKENKDWIKSYQDSITPVEIDEFYIHPSWYEAKENKINILIDPALAFGSGHHETTSSCVKAIKQYVNENDEVLDVGCGSGILSIISSKVGATVDLCDTDELSVRSAKENFELNSEKYNNIWQGSANLATKTYDVVIANIIADVLIFINKDLKKVSKNILILSGIIDKYKEKVIDKFKDYDLIEVIEDNEWVTLILKNKDQ